MHIRQHTAITHTTICYTRTRITAATICWCVFIVNIVCGGACCVLVYGVMVCVWVCVCCDALHGVVVHCHQLYSVGMCCCAACASMYGCGCIYVYVTWHCYMAIRVDAWTYAFVVGCACVDMCRCLLSRCVVRYFGMTLRFAQYCVVGCCIMMVCYVVCVCVVTCVIV